MHVQMFQNLPNASSFWIIWNSSSGGRLILSAILLENQHQNPFYCYLWLELNISITSGSKIESMSVIPNLPSLYPWLISDESVIFWAICSTGNGVTRRGANS